MSSSMDESVMSSFESFYYWKYCRKAKIVSVANLVSSREMWENEKAKDEKLKKLINEILSKIINVKNIVKYLKKKKKLTNEMN